MMRQKNGLWTILKSKIGGDFMTAAIAYFIAGISIFVLLVFWFFNVYKILSRKRMDVRRAEEQVGLQREGFRQMLGSRDEQAAGQMLAISSQIYTQIEKGYNDTFRKPIYRFPGVLMGFSRAESGWEIKEEDQLQLITEQQETDYHMKEEQII
jgi:hypothetical protein